MEVARIDSLAYLNESGRHFCARVAGAHAHPSRMPRGLVNIRRKFMTNTLVKFGLAACCLLFAGMMDHDRAAVPAQVVALDECDLDTFKLPSNVGPGFCKNVALGYPPLGYTTTFSQLFAEAAAGTPDPKWDFEPDTLTVDEGTPVIAVNEGGEPHTFTEVAHFAGGFIPPLNGGEDAAPECALGFSS